MGSIVGKMPYSNIIKSFEARRRDAAVRTADIAMPL